MKLKLLTYILILLSGSTLSAAESDNTLDLKADSSDCTTLDMIDCTMTGNVEITQADAKITADKLYSISASSWELSGNVLIERTGMSINSEKAQVSLVENQLSDVKLVGSPVSFYYSIDGNQQANGQADNISFDMNKRVISLDGNARLVQGGNELTGEHVEYDLNKERLKANNTTGDKKGRVHLVFEPPKKKSESESNTETTQQDNN